MCSCDDFAQSEDGGRWLGTCRRRASPAGLRPTSQRVALRSSPRCHRRCRLCAAHEQPVSPDAMARLLCRSGVGFVFVCCEYLFSHLLKDFVLLGSVLLSDMSWACTCMLAVCHRARCSGMESHKQSYYQIERKFAIGFFY